MAKQTTSATALSFNSTESVVSRLGLKPRVEDNNLCKVNIVKFEVVDSEISTTKDDGFENTYQYAGLTIPRLVIEFRQIPTQQDPNERFLTYSWSPAVTVKSDGTELEAKKVMDVAHTMYQQIMHIVHSFKGVKGYDCPETNLILDPFSPINDRMAQYRGLFEFAVSCLSGEEGLIVETVPMWLKIVTDYKKGTFLTLPTFVGKGFIEQYKKGQLPTLEFTANDTQVLKSNSRTGDKTAGAQAAPASSDDPDVQEILSKYGSDN